MKERKLYDVGDAFKALNELLETPLKVTPKPTQTLTEGFIDQTLEDFLENCIEPSTIDRLIVIDISDGDKETIIYKGDYDDLPEHIKELEFQDFNVGEEEEITFNVDVNSINDYYYSLNDIIEDYTGDSVVVYDLETGDIVFEGNKEDISENLFGSGFISFDAPTQLIVRVSKEPIIKKEKKADEKEEIEESFNYSPQELLNAVIDAYGYTKQEAEKYIKTLSYKSKELLVKGFRQDAKKNFYEDKLNEYHGFETDGTNYFPEEEVKKYYPKEVENPDTIWAYQFPYLSHEDDLNQIDFVGLEIVTNMKGRNLSDSIVLKGTRKQLEEFCSFLDYDMHPNYIFPIEKYNYRWINENLKEDVDDNIKFVISLRDEKDGRIIEGLIGQLSDGMWENSPHMEKYWTTMEVEGKDLIIKRVSKYNKYRRSWFNPFNTEQQAKAWVAGKLKEIIKAEFEDKDSWSRTNKEITEYISYESDITVADVYSLYDWLLGRKERVIKEGAEQQLNEVKFETCEIVAEYSNKDGDDNIMVMKSPSGKYYNYYGVKGTGLVGPFQSEEEAIEAVRKHRPFVFEAQDEVIKDNITKINKGFKSVETLVEGERFNLKDKEDMARAKENNKEEQPIEEIVDVNAESISELNKTGYVGSIILQCPVCKTLFYLAPDELEKIEGEDDLYASSDPNSELHIDNGCPHCHAEDEGYKVIGQVGEYVEEEEELDIGEGGIDPDAEEKQEEIPELETKEGEVSSEEEELDEAKLKKFIATGFSEDKDDKGTTWEFSAKDIEDARAKARRHFSNLKRIIVAEVKENKELDESKQLTEDKLFAYNPELWESEDIELHKSIDWEARNYEDYIIEDDFITHPAYIVGRKEEPKEIKFYKTLRSNPIYPPYYGTEESPFEDTTNGMFNGEKHGKYNIHNRFETWEVYDSMFESLSLIKFTVKLKNEDDIDSLNILDEISINHKCESYLDDDFVMHITGTKENVDKAREQVVQLLGDKATLSELEKDTAYNTIDDGFNELDEDAFNGLVNDYLIEIYKDDRKYKISEGFINTDKNTIRLKGIIEKQDNTKDDLEFVFEYKTLNKGSIKLTSLTESKINLLGKIKAKSLVVEVLNYIHKLDESQTIKNRIVKRK